MLLIIIHSYYCDCVYSSSSWDNGWLCRPQPCYVLFSIIRKVLMNRSASPSVPNPEVPKNIGHTHSSDLNALSKLNTHADTHTSVELNELTWFSFVWNIWNEVLGNQVLFGHWEIPVVLIQECMNPHFTLQKDGAEQTSRPILLNLSWPDSSTAQPQTLSVSLSLSLCCLILFLFIPLPLYLSNEVRDWVCIKVRATQRVNHAACVSRHIVLMKTASMSLPVYYRIQNGML